MHCKEIEDEERLVAALLQMSATRDYSEETRLAARLTILDSVGVGLGTLDHPAVVAATEYVDGYLSYEENASVWGRDYKSSVGGALVANTVPLRCYDFNDVMHGRTGQAGHPSDFVPGLIAVAEAKHLSGQELIDATVVAYDAAKILFDIINVAESGWDYANLTGLASVAGFASLLKLSAEQGAQALGIFASSHIATNQLESGELSASGNLTMWKRFNGAEAVHAALRACHLATSSVEAPFHSLFGDAGFFSQQAPGGASGAHNLNTDLVDLRGVEIVEFKKWPVGTRAQSVIAAAQACRNQMGSIGRIDSVEITVQTSVVKHLVRDTAYEPNSRETADHSLPYIVALALLFGDVTIDHFNTDEFFHHEDVRDILSKMEIRGTADPDQAQRSSFPTRIRVTSNGKTYEGTGEYPPSQIRAVAFQEEIKKKFITLAKRSLTEKKAHAVHQSILTLDSMTDVAELGTLLR